MREFYETSNVFNENFQDKGEIKWNGSNQSVLRHTDTFMDNFYIGDILLTVRQRVPDVVASVDHPGVLKAWPHHRGVVVSACGTENAINLIVYSMI